ncbi:MAG TPA: molybdopterin molybdenumtransferase MoeA, partial [Burkholderiaceae bacterium]|nr:molybdopterin molybdenumtransferase MoeA [Burkholderiaceae bacterium]
MPQVQPSGAPLMSLDEAIERLLEGARGHVIDEFEVVSTFDALQRVLAQDVRSGLNVPPEDNSEMDGYALRAADVAAAGIMLPVSQRIPAGQVGHGLRNGTAARIFTGAQIPPGADAVVMQELCDAIVPVRDGDLGSVRVRTVPTVGMSIRRRGEDVAFDAVVLRRGARITPQAMGLAAAVGAA